MFGERHYVVHLDIVTTGFAIGLGEVEPAALQVTP
jgi:hypothetical protein